MKIAKHISFIAIILCAFVLLCACTNPRNHPADNSGNPPSNGISDESLSQDTAAEESSDAKDTLPAYNPVEIGEKYVGESSELWIGPYQTKENGGLPYFGMDLPDKIYRIDAGDTFDEIKVYSFSEESDLHIPEHTVEITVLEPNLVSVKILDQNRLLGRADTGGLSVTGLEPGIAHIFIKVTHTPTGGSETFQLIVIVRNPAE